MKRYIMEILTRGQDWLVLEMRTETTIKDMAHAATMYFDKVWPQRHDDRFRITVLANGVYVDVTRPVADLVLAQHPDMASIPALAAAVEGVTA
jgi:hypothetical protein